MDILVLVEDSFDADHGAANPAAPLANVSSIPDAAFDGPFDGAGRDVVTLYGLVDAERLATALAAAVEGRRVGDAPPGAVWHLGVWADRGAVGDQAWRDRDTGQLVTQDVEISAEAIAATACRLLAECGSAIRQTVAGLGMTDWPEGVRRAIQFSLGAPFAGGPCGSEALLAGVGGGDALLASLREADGYDDGGD